MAKKPKGDGKIDPELEKTFDKLGIPLEERLALSGNVAVDAIMDSVSVKTTFKEKLSELGVIFCSIGDAIKNHPDLVREYLGTVVPYRDNFFAALNSAVFSDGSFVYIPKGVRCPMELSSYFRINARNTGQFERTLIIADDDAYVSYLEGCTAPMRDENQLHAAIVEIIVKDRAEVKYSTVQNWYPGDENGKGGVLNLVTKRGDLRGVDSKLSWTQVETGSAITWKYPSCVLSGEGSQAEFRRHPLQVVVHPPPLSGPHPGRDPLPAHHVRVVDDEMGVGDVSAVVVVVVDRHLVVAEMLLSPGCHELPEGRQVDVIPGIRGDDDVLEGARGCIAIHGIWPVVLSIDPQIVHLLPDRPSIEVDLLADDDVGSYCAVPAREVGDAAPHRR
jgi:hypothetical protein